MAKTSTVMPETAVTTLELTQQFIQKCEELKSIAQLLVADYKRETEGQMMLGIGRLNLAQTALRVAKRRSELIEPYFPVATLEGKVDFYTKVATYTGHLDTVYSVLELKRSDVGKDIVWFAYRIADILSLKSKFDSEARAELDELNKAIKELVGNKSAIKKAPLENAAIKN